MIVGPCSIHDTEAGIEYAHRLAALAERLRDKLYLVMRVYFEKPRTTVGWKGLIMDPRLDGTDDIPEGLRRARHFLRSVIDLGLPTATELLDPITPQYIADLISWSAIGARTAEARRTGRCVRAFNAARFQEHDLRRSRRRDQRGEGRRAAADFSGSVGGGHRVGRHHPGNPDCHVILRGGDHGRTTTKLVFPPPRAALTAAETPAEPGDRRFPRQLRKDCAKMPGVFREIVRQRAAGDRSITGAMLESNLVAGNQSFPKPLDQLIRGQSITDSCIDWETTEELLREAAGML